MVIMLALSPPPPAGRMLPPAAAVRALSTQTNEPVQIASQLQRRLHMNSFVFFFFELKHEQKGFPVLLRTPVQCVHTFIKIEKG